jgi:NAD(P)-dependent dehydrogenase (short-subunit alcohol dehydrogenase family)
LRAVAADFDPAKSCILPLDITSLEQVGRAEQSLCAQWAGYDLVIVMAGDYRPMHAWDFELGAVEHVLAVNLHGPLNVLAQVLPRLLAQRSGGLALVSSVAGYRGLPKSLAYGPSKAALINLAESLYFDLTPRGIGVYLINPGFVRTPLTAQNDFEMPALITADEAAAEIIRGFARGDFEIHFPRRFSRVMKLLRHLPYRWYFSLIARKTRT